MESRLLMRLTRLIPELLGVNLKKISGSERLALYRY